jgi:hypothetical protein
MTVELKQRFTLADEALGAPDLWAEAKRRAVDERPLGRGSETPWSPDRHRLVTAAVAFAVFAAAALFAWDLSHPDSSPVPEPGVDLGAELPEGWSELPAPPENRSGAATAWTGSELLVWGGHEFVGHGDEDPDGDGFAFDGASRRWRTLPDSPLAGRSDAASAWTGEELLIWGGYDGGFREEPFFDDGAAFDPEAGTWRMLPDPPVGARTPFSVWTGRELIVWGSTDRNARMRDGAAYDPVTDTWRRIAEAPVDITDGSAVWTGREMIVFGAALDGNNRADTPTAIGAAYDPAADSWRELPPSDLSPQASTAEWLDGELIAWDYEQASAAYDPVSDRWRALKEVPISSSECRPVTVATERAVVAVFGEFCGETVMFSPEEDAWHRIRMPLPSETKGGCCWVHEPVTADGVVLVPSHLYGMKLEALERRMFVYNPASIVRTDPLGEVLEPEPFIPPTQRDGDRIRLPVTFPDGSSATLVYPIPLDLATLGVQPDVSYIWKEYPPPRFPIVFLHDPGASIERYVEGSAPIGTLGSGFELWKAADRLYGLDLQTRFQLVTRLPEWTVVVALRDQLEAEEVAAALKIWDTANGFPVVSTSGPIGLARGFGEAEGPQLGIGDGSADPSRTSLDPLILLSPQGCGAGDDEISPSGEYASMCLAGGSLFASVYGDRPTVQAIVEGLGAEQFVAAPRT